MFFNLGGSWFLRDSHDVGEGPLDGCFTSVENAVDQAGKFVCHLWDSKHLHRHFVRAHGLSSWLSLG